MFVRVKKIGAYEYLYLVENAREGGRHVQRVIKALGRRDEVEASGLLDGLIVQKSEQTGTGFRSKAAGDFGGKRRVISLQSGTGFRRFRHP